MGAGCVPILAQPNSLVWGKELSNPSFSFFTLTYAMQLELRNAIIR